MEGEDDGSKKKPHRKSLAGRKADKKKGKEGNKFENVDPKIRNPKAFTFNSVVSAERKFRRTQDIETKKERIPLVDRTPVEAPPFIIALVGPPKVGKSTLFQNLVKNYTRHSLSDVKGPVTIVSGKKRRLTFIECNNDINSMIDIAKVADLVLLLVDASFGFEMEVFEFLNICQVHGFPQIMGVLTHLDMIKNKNTLKKVKKTLKHRFWTEVYAGSKLFYLSGYHPLTQSYPKNEIQNLARFIAVMKFRPTVWRSEHAYLVADRMEDLTSPESLRTNPKTDRTISFYGYIHGTFLKPRVSIHIPGLGDFLPEAVTPLSDPCPLPLKERALKRSLNEKEKLIYAPFSGVGGIVYDKDAVYIDLGGSHSHNRSKGQEDSKNANPLLGELHDLKATLNEKMESATIQLFSNSQAITAAEVEDPVLGTETPREKNKLTTKPQDDDEDENVSEDDIEESDDEEIDFQNSSDEDSGSDMDENTQEGTTFEDTLEGKIEKSKARRVEEAADAFYSRFRNRSMQKMIYDDTADFMNVTSRADFDLANCNAPEEVNLEEMEEDDLKDLFVGGDYAESAKKLLDADDDDPFGFGDDEDVFGDFETLDGGDEGDDDGTKNRKKDEPKEEVSEEKRVELKEKLKEKFDMEYDDGGDKSFYKDWKSQVEEQAKINRTFFDNIEDPKLLQELQGLPPGSYVRVEISRVPCEFIQNFDPQRTSPLVIGSLDTPNQETLAVVQARVKKHRWFPKILKTRDPIILSVGWRRFQTISLYSVHDHNMRNRMIKYTPEHLHCVANFYGPMTPQGTGILGIAPQGFEGFRIVLTGAVLDMDKSTELVKKLKLVGQPTKIYKKSAFLEGMFSSQLEVARFIGAKIKTVSGIRGVIKKPLRTPPGACRATFEDKILASDIVFCRTWAPVDIPQFFLNIASHVTPQLRLAKTVGQLKREQAIQAEPNPDNLYTPIERPKKEFKPLQIPKSLKEKLPYKDRPKIKEKLKMEQRIAVIKEPHERKMSETLKLMKQRVKERDEREKADKAKKGVERAKILKKVEERQTYRQKELRKKIFKTLGQMNKGTDSASSGGGAKGKFRKKPQ
ncbi:unnamed protein product [Allacma fusca]|uniref:Bms1-type G domain-containing protein n=1 Tax=Allacma fusca TaxID=39272 RepID=A0A8J2JWM8_9HEXA|nr:unnamed protein product [Allacma fusca]